MNTASTSMSVESVNRPILFVALALGHPVGHPVIPAKAGIHWACAGKLASKLASSPRREEPHGFPL